MATDTIHVLMCCSDLNRVRGGMVSVVRNLLGYKGWQNCRIHYVPTHVEGNALKKLSYFAVGYVRVLASLLFRRIDVVHLHVSENGSVTRKRMILNLAKLFHKPVILHHHGANFNLYFQKLSPRKQQKVISFLERADCNLVLSEGVKQDFLVKAPRAHYRVLRNSVSVPSANRYRSDANLIVTMGRLGQRKGTFDLLKALQTLDSRLPARIQFCLCGDGDTDEVRRLTEQYGLSHRVQHIGWVSGTQKEEILSRAICHVLPSYREVLPMSILETMSLGIPNISTRIASIPEVITDGEDGMLIQPGDTQALANDILALCTDEALRMQISNRAYERIRTAFSVESCCSQLQQIYKEVRKNACSKN